MNRSLWCVWIGMALMVGFASSPASAQKPLDPRSQEYLQQARAALASITIRQDLRGTLPPAKVAEAAQESRNVRAAIERAENALMGVRSQDRRHPATLAVRQEIPRYKAYLADLERAVSAAGAQRQAAEQANASIRLKFWSEFRADHERLKEQGYYAFVNDPYPVGMPYGTQKDLLAAKQALARIHAGCTGPYRALVNDSTTRFNEAESRPELMCKAAAMADEIIKRRVVGMARYVVAETLKGFKKTLENIASDDGRLKDVDKHALYDPAAFRAELEKRFASDLASVGATLPQDLLADLESSRAALLAAIPKHVSRWKWGGHGSPGTDPFVKKSYEQAEKGLKVLKMEIYSNQWDVTVDHRGVPKYRTKKGGLLFKLPGESWCHEDAYAYFQDYQGNKRFGQSYFEHPLKNLRHARIVDCK